MEEQRQSSEPITYVGGLGDVSKSKAWPFIALGLLPILLAVLLVVFWNPIRALGNGAGKTVAPYSLALTDAGWSTDDIIATVPVDLVVSVQNTDQRTINGMTLRFAKLPAAWQILGASSPNVHGVVSGSSIFFPNQIRPEGTLRMSVTMRASHATNADIGVTLSAGHDSNPAHVLLYDGSTATTLYLLAKARQPTEDDAYARLTALYDPLPTKGDQSGWQIHVSNTGPIAINQIRLAFPPTVRSQFELLYLASQATLLSDGTTLQFDLSLPPGGQTILYAGVVPHVAGHFQIPIQVYLEKSGVPLIAADGGPPITVDLTVN
jgi:hypothetical protein